MTTLITSTTLTSGYQLLADSTGTLVIQTGSGPSTSLYVDSTQIKFYTSNTERLKIDANGMQTSTIAGFQFTESSGVYTPVGKTRVTYAATGAQQTLVIPAGINYIFAKLWGAGGGGGNAGGWNFGSPGGAGGHSYGIIPVTPGATYYIVVGAAGQTNYAGGITLGYGGGGGFATNSDNRYASSAGGYTGIFNSVTPSQGAALLIAGGGGGGGASRQGYGNSGGAGGGSTGQDGGSPYDAKSAIGGKGGTQTAGGVAGTGAQAGGALFGGYGGTTGSPYGGAGGGGYWGGGGGGYSESNTMAGGAGGSGFVGTSVLMGATFTGNGPIPAFSFDNDLSKSIDTYRNCVPFANGGPTNQTAAQLSNTYGGSGYVVIYY